jgi:hypothetical protein
VDDEVFNTYFEKMRESAQKLDELMMNYDEIDNSLPGQGREMLRVTLQNAVRLASKLKPSPLYHMTLAGLYKFLKQQNVDLDKLEDCLELLALEEEEVRQLMVWCSPGRLCDSELHCTMHDMSTM